MSIIEQGLAESMAREGRIGEGIFHIISPFIAVEG
jgi:hypothetical protein